MIEGWIKGCFTVHPLDGLFRQGSRLSRLYQRRNSVCCTLSFVSNHRNLLITVSVRLLLFMIWQDKHMYLHASLKSHGNESDTFKLFLLEIHNEKPQGTAALKFFVVHYLIYGPSASLRWGSVGVADGNHGYWSYSFGSF